MSERYNEKVTQGTVLRSFALEELQLTETVYPASFRMASHEHEQAYICTVLQGVYDETIAGRTRECRSATVSFHPPYEGHTVRFLERPVHIFRLDLSPAWFDRVRQHTPIFQESRHVRDGLPSCLALRLYREFCTRDSVAPLAVEGLALELVAESSRLRSDRDRRPPTWLLAARDLLHTRYADGVTVAEMGQEVGVHPVHLARAFRTHFRTTVGDYVRRLRVESACRRLAHSDDPLVEIALDHGFSDQGHFTRTFKQLTDLTPSQYRKTFRTR